MGRPDPAQLGPARLGWARLPAGRARLSAARTVHGDSAPLGAGAAMGRRPRSLPAL